MNTGILGGNRSHIGRESYLGVNEKNYRKGFTLVELIVVLVILAILAAIAVPVTLGFIDKARDKEFVANAETSLSATQTVLNDVYNDGLGCLPVTKRIEAYNAALAGKIENNGETTSFKIWTSKKLEHGKTHATKDEIGSYTIAKALYISDGKAAVYDGAEWKIYDKESDAIAACAGFQNDITIWPIENASSFKDDAYDPTLALAEVDVSEEEPQYFDSMLTVNVLSVAEMISFEKAPTLFDSISFDVNLGDDQDKIKSDILTKLEEYSWIISKKYKQNPDDIVWMIKYAEEQDIQALTRAGIADYIADKKESFKENSVTAIEFTPSVGPKKITIRADFESVGMLTVELGTANREYVYNIVDETFTTPDLSGVSVGGTQAGVITFGNKWAVKKAENSYDFVTFSGTDQTAVDQYIHTFAATRAQDFENNDFEGTEVVAFLAAADVAKKIYLSDKKVGDTYANKVYFKMGDNESSKLLVATVTKNELLNEVKAGDETVGTYTYTKNDAGEIVDSTFTFSGNYSLLNGVTQTKASDKLKTKWWYVYDCDENGAKVSPDESFRTRKGNPTKEIFESLYAPGNNNLGEIAELDLSEATALLDSRPLSTDQSPIIEMLYKLAEGSGTLGTLGVNSTNATLEKIKSINFIAPPTDKPLATTAITREVCFSSDTTNIPANGNFLKRDANGYYDIKDEDRDEEYPGYIVAYSVKGTDGKYDIYVFSEDGTDVKAIGSLQSMFACCKGMSTNTLVDHMDTTGINCTHMMFYNCVNLNLSVAAINSIDTRSAQKTSYMFYGCGGLQQPEGSDTVNIRIDSATTIQKMFYGCSLKDITLEGGGESHLGNSTAATGNVFDNSGLLHLTLKNLNFVEFLQSDDEDKVQTGKNGSFTYMDLDLNNGLYNLTFSAVSPANTKLLSIKFENVRAEGIGTARSLLRGATKLREADLSGLALPNNKSLRALFYGCSSLESGNIKLGSQLIDSNSYIINMASAFNTCRGIDALENVSGLSFYLDHAKYLDWMLENCTSLTSLNLNIQTAYSMQEMCKGCTNLETIVLFGNANSCILPAGASGCQMDNAGAKDAFINSGLKDLTIKNIVFSNFRNDASTSNTKSGLDNMLGSAKTNLEHVTIQDVGLPNVKSMATLFQNSTKLKDVTFKNVNSDLQRMKYMFYKDKALTKVTFDNLNARNILNMTSVFEECENLETVEFINGPELYMDTSHATDMNVTFKNCYALKSVDVSFFKTSSVTKHEEMFMNCYSLEYLDTTGFTSEKCDNFTNMFSGCRSLKVLDLSNWNPKQSANFTTMFGGTEESSLYRIYASENFALTNVNTNMFGTGLIHLTGQEGTNLNVQKSADGSNYFRSKYARIDGFGGPGYFTCKGKAKLNLSGQGKLRDAMTALGASYDNLVAFRRNTNYVSAKNTYDQLAATDSTRVAIWSPEGDANYPGTVYAYSDIADNGDVTIYWFSESDRVYLEGDYSEIFKYHSNDANVEKRCAYSKLTDVSGLLDFDFSGVTSMRLAFKYCTGLESIVFNSSFENCENYHQMCESCTSLKVITNLQEGNVKPGNGGNNDNYALGSVFNHCQQLQDISFFHNADVSECSNICKMFNDCGPNIKPLIVDMLKTWTFGTNPPFMTHSNKARRRFRTSNTRIGFETGVQYECKDVYIKFDNDEAITQVIPKN